MWLNYLTDACGGSRSRAPTIKSPAKLQGWMKKRPAKGKPWKKHWFLQVDMDLVEYESDAKGEPELARLKLVDIHNVDVTFEGAS